MWQGLEALSGDPGRPSRAPPKRSPLEPLKVPAPNRGALEDVPPNSKMANEKRNGQ